MPLLIFLSVAVHADELPQPSLRAALQALATKVSTLERHDEKFLDEILPKYENKCAKAEGNCYLTEADVYKGGSPDRVLLFRGERDFYPYPGASVGAIHALQGSYFCDNNCSWLNYSRGLERELGFLVTHQYFNRRNHRFYEATAFDERIGEWRMVDGSKSWGADGVPVLLPLIEPKPDSDNITAAELIASEHFQGGGTLTISPQGKMTDELGVLVSYTDRPKVAMSFAQPNSPNKLGRLLMLSVPRSAIPEPDCKAWLPPTQGAFADLTACNLNDDYSFEHELDAMFYTDVKTLRDVIIVDDSKRRVGPLN